MTYIGDTLESLAETRPDDTALICGSVRWGWRELTGRIEAAEHHISRLSPRGGRIALLLNDPAALLVCFFACARSARIAMVMDPQWPEAQLATVFAAARPDLQLDATAYSVIEKAFLAGNISGGPVTDIPPEESDLFYCGFTSGSTGTPKGYVRTHGSWLRSFELSNREFGIDGSNRIVLAGQLTHSLHLYGAVCGLACGQQVALTTRFDPRSVLADLESADKGSVLYATPTQLHFIAQAARRSGSLAAVRQVLASGAKWRDEEREALFKTFPQAQLIEFYGASETSFITVSKSGTSIPAGSVGCAPKGIQLAIGDPDAPLPAGQGGAVWVKSSLLFSGYLCGNDPETRWKAGWLTFGDHGYLNADGYLFLTGRANRMVITSGLNVYPEEVEAVLMAHTAVAAGVVIGLPDPVRGHRLEAAVQLNAPLANAEDILLNHCRAHLAAGKLPRKIHFYDQLPLTAGGKPDIQRVSLELMTGRPKD